jgi:hypothetical protein
MERVNVGAGQVSTAASVDVAAAVTANPGKAKVAVSFIGRDKDLVLAGMIAGILAAMTGNAVYAAPLPTLATLTTARDAFVAAVQGNDGGAAAVVKRNQARAAVEEVLRELAAYVQHACQGDLLRLMGSGFPAQSQRGVAVVQPLLPPTGLKVSRGNASGQVLVRCAQVPSARLYQWRYASAQTPTAWTLVDTSSSSAKTLEGLAAGTLYTLQVRALGKRGASDWSQGVTLMAA